MTQGCGRNGVEKVYTFPENPHSLRRPKKKKTTQKLHIPTPVFQVLSLSPTPPTVRTTRRLEELHHVGMVKPKVPNPVIE